MRNSTENVIGNWEDSTYDNPQPVSYVLEPMSVLLPLEYRLEFEENIGYLLYKAAQPPEPPAFPDIISIEDPQRLNCITISWLEPLDNSALITEYQIEWDLGTYAGLGVGPTLYPRKMIEDGIGPTTFRARLCYFVEYTDYRICVRARNKIGLSIPCLDDDSLVAIVRTKPYIPTGVFNSTAIPDKRALDILWLYPKDYGNLIKNYTLVVRDRFFQQRTFHINATNTEQESFLVTELIPFSNYTWTIIAFNDFGTYNEPPVQFIMQTLPAGKNFLKKRKKMSF